MSFANKLQCKYLKRINNLLSRDLNMYLLMQLCICGVNV